MRILFLAIFYFLSNIARAQKVAKIDSIYFLLDTIKTPVNDRMWGVTKTDFYRHYELRCPCLNSSGTPVFSYELREKGETINEDRLKVLKLISITSLISISKKFLDEGNLWGQYLFFIVEPKGNQYTIHQVTPMNPKTKIVSLPDVIQAKPDTSAFAIKGIKKIKADDVKRHLNEVIITSGNCVTSMIDGDASVLLFVKGDSGGDFKIFIKKGDRDKFDLPELHYKGRKIKVTGKVINYKGQPVINITNENQIL